MNWLNGKDMKQTLKAVIILPAVLWLSCVVSPVYAQSQNSSNYYHIRQDKTQDQGVLVSKPRDLDSNILKVLQDNGITSIEDYARWLEKNMTYNSDSQKWIWKEPLKVMRAGQGDCEDFAALNQAVARVLGFDPKFIALVGKDGGHAVCLFKKDGYYVWFDNAKLKTTNLQTVQDFANLMTSDYQYQEVLEFDLEQRDWIQIYKKA